MTTYVIVGATALGQSVARQLIARADSAVRMVHTAKSQLAADLAAQVTEFTGDLTKEASYQEALKDQPIVFSALTGMDVDLAFEALFDAQYHQRLQLTRFVMLSTAALTRSSGELTTQGLRTSRSTLISNVTQPNWLTKRNFPIPFCGLSR